MTLARRLALDILCGAERRHGRGSRPAELGRTGVRQALDEALRRHRPSPQDSGLLTELVYGGIRRLGTLDAIIAKFANAPLRRLDPNVRAALQLGVYQIVYLDRVPDAAAVNETVRLVKAKSGHRSASFVNAVLRSVCREIEARHVSALPPADRRRAVRCPDGSFALFKSDIFPDPTSSPGDWLAQACSMPRWLVSRWIARFGLEETEEVCSAHNRTPRLFVRANLRRINRDALVARLRAAGLDPHEAEDSRPECVDLGTRAPIGKLLPLLNAGLCTVQDHTAMQAAHELAPAAGDRVLEVCAAPGGKTTHLAEIADDAAPIVAVDASAERAAKIVANSRRLGLCSIAAVCADGARLPVAGVFDKVLLDAPCSNTGVLARRVDARWRVRESDLGRLAAMQLDLLRAAGEHVRPGGWIVYSTCSMEPEENQRVARQLIGRSPQFELLHEEEFLPHRVPGDGGYVARLTRR